jgi:hypothetical protein
MSTNAEEFVWCFKTGDEWKEYTETQSRKIENAYIKKQKTVKV